MASIKGIGGVFFESEHLERVANWYQNVLGISLENHPDGIGYYHVFTTLDAETSIQRENPVFAINFAKDTLARGNRGFTINFRVDNLFEFLDQLKQKGVEQEGEILEWERGKHAWVRDPDGNLIELYEEILID